MKFEAPFIAQRHSGKSRARKNSNFRDTGSIEVHPQQLQSSSPAVSTSATWEFESASAAQSQNSSTESQQKLRVPTAAQKHNGNLEFSEGFVVVQMCRNPQSSLNMYYLFKCIKNPYHAN